MLSCTVVPICWSCLAYQPPIGMHESQIPFRWIVLTGPPLVVHILTDTPDPNNHHFHEQSVSHSKRPLHFHNVFHSHCLDVPRSNPYNPNLIHAQSPEVIHSRGPNALRPSTLAIQAPATLTSPMPQNLTFSHFHQALGEESSSNDEMEENGKHGESNNASN